MRVAATVMAIGLTVVIVGCAPATTMKPVPSASPTPASATPTASTAGSSTPSPASATASPGSVAIDASLLGHLPVSVDSVNLVEDRTTAAAIAADPSLGQSASGISVAFAISDTSTDGDLAIASVVQLRPGIYSDPFFAEWRASYDQASCAQAGGAGASVAQVIGGHDAFVGTCQGGASTYHVHLPDDILVSVTSTGSRHFGALVIAGLR